MSNVGKILYGHCNGFFGRDSFHNKRIEAEGYDWIVARSVQCGDVDEKPEFATFDSADEKDDSLAAWSLRS